MKSSIILNNSPKCPYCFENDYNKLKAIEADVAFIDNEKHFEITMLCKNCDEKSYYFLDMDMKNRKDVDKKSGRYKKAIYDFSSIMKTLG